MIGRFSSMSSGKKNKESTAAKYRPTRPAAAGPGGLNNTTIIVVIIIALNDLAAWAMASTGIPASN